MTGNESGDGAELGRRYYERMSAPIVLTPIDEQMIKELLQLDAEGEPGALGSH